LYRLPSTHPHPRPTRSKSHPLNPNHRTNPNHQSVAFDALRLSAQLAYEVFAATREQAPAALCEAAQLLHTHALLVR